MDDLTIIKFITIAYVVVVAILAYKLRNLKDKTEYQYDFIKALVDTIAVTARSSDNMLEKQLKTQNDAVVGMFNRYNRLLNYLKLEDVTIAEEKVIRKLKRGKK